jgi:hypothetical protein
VEAELPDDIDEAAVIVPQTPCPLEDVALTTFVEFVSRLPQADPWDTEYYLSSVTLLDNLLSGE